jgi:hypothetical protein
MSIGNACEEDMPLRRSWILFQQASDNQFVSRLESQAVLSE